MYSDTTSGLKEALEYLVDLEQTRVIDLPDGRKFMTGEAHEILEPIAKGLTSSTLTSLVNYIKNGVDGCQSLPLIVHITAPDEVVLYSALRCDKRRETFMQCKAILPHVEYGRFIGMEEFNIMLQSEFVQNDDCAILLRVVGNIKEENVKNVNDDGISQAVVAKVGIADWGNVKVPNPVTLAPFRTFPELIQVESKFIFRMKTGPFAALFEADGGAWRNLAMEEIWSYLHESLKELPNVQIIF